jgi:hypothetical protein
MRKKTWFGGALALIVLGLVAVMSMAVTAPYDPSPEHGATGVAWESATLSWMTEIASHDPSDITFDLALSFSDSDWSGATVFAGIPCSSEDPYRTEFTLPAHLALQPGTTYYWRVTKHVSGDADELGAVWEFTTMPKVEKAYGPSPADGATGIGFESANFDWESNAEGNASFDVYVGEAGGPLTQVAANVTTTDYTLPTLLKPDTEYQWRIDTVTTGTRIPGDVWTFRTAADLELPYDPAPEDGTEAVVTEGTEFTWACDTPSALYDFYLGTNPASPVLRAANLGSPAYTSDLILEPGTTYYWKVVVKGSGGEELAGSPIWSFTTEPAQAKAHTPAPVDAATLVPVSSDTVSWQSEFSTAVFNLYRGSDPASLVPVVLGLADTEYDFGHDWSYGTDVYWRVDTCVAGRVITGDVWHFRTQPDLQAASGPTPSDMATSIPVTGSLSWTGTAGATHTLWLGTDPASLTQVYVGTATSYSFPAPLANETTYYWKVDSTLEGATVLGSTWRFVTVGTVAMVHTPAPADNAVGVLTAGATLAWECDTAGASFDVYVGPAAGSLTPVVTGAVLTNYAFPAPLTAGTDYYWRVDAHHAGATVTGPVWHFRTVPELAKAYGPTPAHGAEGIVRSGVSLEWESDMPAGALFTLYAGTDPSSLAQIAAPLTEKSHPLVFDLPYGTTYYWRVDTTVDGQTVTGDVWHFTTLYDVTKAYGPTPAFGATDVEPAHPAFVWQTDVAGARFDLLFGTDPADLAQVATGLGTTSYTLPANLSADTDYYWRVDTLFNDQAASGDVWTFRTKPTVSAVHTPSPQDASFGADYLAPTLGWECDTVGATFDVYLSTTESDLGSARVTGLGTKTWHMDMNLNPDTVYYWRVDARVGGVTTAGPVWSFRTMPVLSAATDPEPENGITKVSNQNLTLSWQSAMPDARTTFNVYWGTSEAGLAPLIMGTPAKVANLLGILPYATTYYWRVDTVVDGHTVTGPVWNFTTMPNVTEAHDPTPANGAGSVAIEDARFGWLSDVTGAAFNFYLGQSETSMVQIASGLSVPEYTLNSLSLNPGTHYYWRVDTVLDGITVQSDLWAFDTQAVVDAVFAPTPSDNALAVPVENTAFAWSCNAETAVYDFYLGSDPANLGSAKATGLAAKAFVLDTLLQKGHIYYWRVDARVGAVTTTGPVWSFRTEPDLVAPTVVSPVNGAYGIDPQGVTLEWDSSVAGATFDLLAGHTPESLGYVVTNLPAQVYTFMTLLPSAQVHYWRVDTKLDGKVLEGPVWSFKTAPQVTASSNPTPADGATGVTIETPALSWESAVAGARHALFFGMSPESLAPLVSGLTENGYVMPMDLTHGKTYYWRVDTASDDIAVQGSVWHFTTAFEVDPVYAPTPSDGQAFVPTTTTLNWSCDTEGASFDVYIGTAPENLTRWAEGLTTKDLQVSGLLNDTDYYWRVDSRNGDALQEGPVWSFHTVYAMTKATPVSPANGGVSVAVENVSMDWVSTLEGRAGVTFDLYMGTSSGDLGLTAANLAASNYTMGSLQPGTQYFWKVVTKATGATDCHSDVWGFTTRYTIDQPYNPTPADNATAVPVNGTTLTWACDTEDVTYDVYFGTDPSALALRAQGVTTTAYGLGTLLNSTNYYWRIDVHKQGTTIQGPSWNFRTAANVTAAYNLTPNGSEVDYSSVTFAWDSDVPGATYRVYLGTTPESLSLRGETEEKQLSGGAVGAGSDYYWRVDTTVDDTTVQSQVIHFATKAEGDEPAPSAAGCNAAGAGPLFLLFLAPLLGLRRKR